MTDSPTIATYRWSSDRAEDRFPVENPATGQIITVVQGGGAPEIDAAVQAAHRAFGDDWRWRTQQIGRGSLLVGVVGPASTTWWARNEKRLVGRAGFESVTSSVSGKSKPIFGVCHRWTESSGEPLTWAKSLSESC